MNEEIDPNIPKVVNPNQKLYMIGVIVVVIILLICVVIYLVMKEPAKPKPLTKTEPVPEDNVKKMAEELKKRVEAEPENVTVQEPEPQEETPQIEQPVN
jgi:hypothetical protein